MKINHENTIVINKESGVINEFVVSDAIDLIITNLENVNARWE